MVVAFYVDEMNFRGVANSTYLYAKYCNSILKYKSLIFYNKNNSSNKIKVIKKFKNRFKIFGISNFKEIDNFQKKFKIEYIYTQKGGERNLWQSNKIKTVIHAVYPQKFKEVHGHNYAFISEWLSEKFSNKKIPYVPYIVEINKTKGNLKKKFQIEKNQLVFGYHGGESSFDLKFTHDALIKIANTRLDIIFLFLNVTKFCDHPRIKFLKGTADEIFKKKFINTCDAMIYGRSLGESFGLSCGEFAMQNKAIISYKFNRHRSHEYSMPKELFYEYGSYNDLCSIIENFDGKKAKLNKQNKYQIYNKHMVMKIFKRVFFKKKNNINLELNDYFLNYKNFIKMHYFYLRHKLYNHYYNFFESKFINFND